MQAPRALVNYVPRGGPHAAAIGCLIGCLRVKL